MLHVTDHPRSGVVYNAGHVCNKPNVVGARELKALIFYTINPHLYKQKRSLCVSETLCGDLHVVQRMLFILGSIGKPVVDFLLVIIELSSLGAMVERILIGSRRL